jgi:TorA maturation chaperone TorD
MSHSNETGATRAAEYRFFARFFVSEPDVEFLEALKSAERFAATLSASLPDLRIEFTRLFTLNVFPYSSIFMDLEAYLNTETTARVEFAYEQAGFEPDPRLAIGAPDHFGVELMFVAHLLESGRELAANEFLSGEILSWAIVFLQAVAINAREEFYKVAAQETGAWLMNEITLPPKPLHLDAVSAPLSDEDDLDAVVTRLLTPARSGIWLSKDDVSSIARDLALPISFGDRALMLKSLFRQAGEYGRTECLFLRLCEQTEQWVRYYAQHAHTYPHMVPILKVWMKRADDSLGQLRQMSRIVQRSG